jgi:hypothetical protein
MPLTWSSGTVWPALGSRNSQPQSRRYSTIESPAFTRLATAGNRKTLDALSLGRADEVIE